MRKERTLLILGVWVALLPYLGFPDSWRKILFLISGLCLIYLAYLFYHQAKARLPKDDTASKTFIDNIGSGE
jgi:hypothetical protein